MTDEQNNLRRVRVVKADDNWGVRVFDGENELTRVSQIRIEPTFLYVISEGEELGWPLNWVEFGNA